MPRLTKANSETILGTIWHCLDTISTLLDTTRGCETLLDTVKQYAENDRHYSDNISYY